MNVPVIYRSVLQGFKPTPEVIALLEEFRAIVNDCLRLGLQSATCEFRDLKALAHQRILKYSVENSYRISAVFEASNLLKKFRTDSKRGPAGRPFCRRPFLSASVGVRVDGGDLVLPDMRRVKLTPHTVSVLARPGVEVNSFTMTMTGLGIMYRKSVGALKTLGMVALDVNLDNVTTFDTDGRSSVYLLSEVVRVQEMYRRTTSRFRRHDFRIKTRIFRKHAALKRNRTDAILHNISSTIVRRAVGLQQTVVMEDLKGIRSLFRKESGSTSDYLSRMNSWPFARLQRMIRYKAESSGLHVVFVGAEGTSSNCNRCGGAIRVLPEEHPMVACRKCGILINRDLNAAMNILRRGLRFGPVWPTREAMEGRGKDDSMSASKVDGGQLTGPPGRATESEHS